MIWSSLYLLVLLSIILRVDGLLEKMNGTVYGEQVRRMPHLFFTPQLKHPLLNIRAIGEGLWIKPSVALRIIFKSNPAVSMQIDT